MNFDPLALPLVAVEVVERYTDLTPVPAATLTVCSATSQWAYNFLFENAEDEGSSNQVEFVGFPSALKYCVPPLAES